MPYSRFDLLPEHGHSLSARDGDGDGQTFAVVFRSVWNEIPLGTRTAILDYWKSQTTSVLFELSNLWCGAEGSFAKTEGAGTRLFFNAEAFLVFPKSAARWVVAHELAHVFQKACGKRPGGDNEDENERDANAIAKSWGFSNSSLVIIRSWMSQGRTLNDACEEAIADGL